MTNETHNALGLNRLLDIVEVELDIVEVKLDKAIKDGQTLCFENSRLSRDLELLSKGYNEIAQAYNTLGNIVSWDRHSSRHYDTCDEQSCIIHRQFLNSILLGDK